MTLMQRAVLTELGWDEPLVYERREAELPVPKGAELLVAIEACGVAHRDLIDRSGRIPFVQLPVVPGHEACGRVIAVGPDARDFAVGDRVATMHRDSCGRCERCVEGEETLCPFATHVFGILADGGYASHVLAPERAFYRVPDALPAELAAVLHSTFGTAYRALNRFGRLGPGKTVLVTGANGGVGVAAVQIGKRQGAHVTAVVRRPEVEAQLVALGADAVIVDDGATFHKKLPDGAVDVVLDLVGAPTFNAALRSTRMGGGLAVVGNIVDAKAEVNLGFICVNDIHFCGSTGASRRDMAGLLELHASSPFTGVVAERIPLEQADAAQRRLRAGGIDGRLVLVP